MTETSDVPAIDPLQLLRRDRALARERGDAMAALCVFATAANDIANVRTLVLRDIEEPAGPVGGRLAVFFSGTSPKATQLRATGQPQALVYLPSLGLQYRLWLRPEAVARALLEKYWPLRPVAARQLDWYYNLGTPQSGAIANRTVLRAAIAAAATDPRASLTVPPQGADGCFLNPDRIERLSLDDTDPPHDRCLYELVGGDWRASVLVP